MSSGTTLTEALIDDLDPDDIERALDLLEEAQLPSDGIETVDDAKHRLRLSLAHGRAGDTGTNVVRSSPAVM